MAKEKLRLGEILIGRNLITEDQLQQALEYQSVRGQNKRLGEILVELNFIDEKRLVQMLEFHLDIPYIDLAEYLLDPQLADLIPENLARRHKVIPLEVKGNTLVVACVDPSDVIALDDIRKTTQYRIEPLIATYKEIEKALNELYIVSEQEEDLFQDLDDSAEVEETDYELDELQKMVEDAPIVRLANLIISRAIQERASDIHLEPQEKKVVVRYRIDGVLSEKMVTPKASQAALISRIKIMANMDISERRKPQDGRINLKKAGIDWDMRISTLPTIFGEKIVIRILDRLGIPLISKLGFSAQDEKTILRIIRNPYGIILVTGPTGSGKSTTLFSALRELNQSDINITTVEDPVEYILPGINQIQTNPKVDMTFANALRSILRQDPDVIMVGEIRDRETANISVNAALTGHLVLSTVHTNDSASTISRLMDMGVEPYLISSTVVAILAQRLVRKICPECKEKQSLSKEDVTFLQREGYDLTEQYVGKGCRACGKTGYRGRMAISELLVLDRELRLAITQKKGIEAIRDLQMQRGSLNIFQNGIERIKEGLTTLEEVLRVATY